MEQYINKADVVAEIERRIKKYATIDVSDCKELEAIYGAKCKALMEILSFLDSLQEEPVSNDLEAEFVLYLKHKFNIPQEGNKLKTNGWNPSNYDILAIAKHFAKWQKEQLIAKACVFLGSTDFCKYYNREFIEEFKKTMEG